MTRERNPRRGYATVALCTALGIGLVAAPAAAGKGGNKAGTTTDVATVDSTYLNEAGTSDPTNVPIVLSDLDSATAVFQPADQIQASQVWSCATGRGVLVAVLDGGFNVNAPAIAQNLAAAGYDAILDRPIETQVELVEDSSGLMTSEACQFADLDDGIYSAYDDVGSSGNGLDDDHDGLVDEGLGHGTFAAGMVLGIAPDATILPIRVRDNEGYGLDEWVVRGVMHAIAQGADVINLSIEAGDAWGPELFDVLNKASASGISIVMSAGNGSNRQISDMAWTVPAIIVGAVDYADQIAEFSDYFDLYPGQWPAIMTFAPGVDLVGPAGFPCDDSYVAWSGTSFSAPLVSGAVALLRELRPEYGPAEIMTLISTTYDPAKSGRRSLKYCGRINVWRAATQ